MGTMGRSARFNEADERDDVPRSDWRSPLVFLPSEAATVGLGLWAAGRFLDPGTSWSEAVLVAVAAWCAVLAGAAALERRWVRNLGGPFRILALAVGVTTVTWVAMILADHLSWLQAGGIGLTLAFALTINRRLRALSLVGERIEPAEGLRWAVLQAAAVFALYPYVRGALVGAGDAYNYGLTLADFTGQAHAGVFPIFVGQTQYGFNGNIHTLRTAPYFAHLGGLLDLLTLRTLPPYALLNLAIIGSAGVGTVGAYVALRIYSPKRPWTAAALAMLYVLSPAFLALLYEGDMVATYMTMPMIPWLVLGIAWSAEHPDDLWPWLVQGTALAALWWAHPAVAFWASALCAGAWAGILGRCGVTAPRLARMASAATLCALLGLYEFTSVLTLKLPPGPDTQAGEAWSILENVRQFWRMAFLPMSAGADSLLGDVQLGYSLLACAVVGVLVPGARRAARFLFIGMLCLLVFLIPVPGITLWLWAHVPHAALDVTNAWPMQRLYPLLAGVALFGAWAGLSEFGSRSRTGKMAMGLMMMACIAWSTHEELKLLRHAQLTRRASGQSAPLYAPGNIALTRVSYMFFGHTPTYFSDGPMDAILETRLLDARTREVFADGTSRLDASSIRPEKAEILGLTDGVSELKIPVRPWEAAILRFDFLGREPFGELQVTSRSMYGIYALPSGGGTKSFGARRANSRVIEIRNDSEKDDVVALTVVSDPSSTELTPRTGVFARVSIEPVTSAGHVIELLSLLPFHARVQIDRDAILETPRMDIPGYRASVNDHILATVRTADGLVGVPLHKGVSDVRLEYPGVPALRWAYGISGVSWFVLLASVLLTPGALHSEKMRPFFAGCEAGVRRYLPPTVLAVGVGAALFIGAPWLWRRSFAPEAGLLRLTVMLPPGKPGQNEPLVETGRTGAADVIYVSFRGGNRVSVGYDKWSLSASDSAPFEVDFTQPQTIEVEMRSLSRRGLWGPAPPTPPGVSVKWNGRKVLSVKREPYPRAESRVEIGRNPLGASSCSATFTGKILSVASANEIAP